ncbi:MAG: hypothetical protein ACYSXF_03035 [Planctomycetota bacterium]
MQRWRSGARLMQSVLTLLLQAFVVFGLASLHSYAVGVFEDGLIRWRVPAHERFEFGVYVVVLVVIGAWLTLAFSHWRRWLVWAAWTALMACVLAIPEIIEPALEWIGRRLNGKAAGRFEIYIGDWLVHLMVLGGTLVVAATGIPLGEAVLRSWARYRARRWSRRRVKARARRTAA